MNIDPKTAHELIQIISGNDTYHRVVERVKALEYAHRSIGAVVRLSFDLPVLKWGAEINVYVDGVVCQVHFHGGITADAVLDRVESSFIAKFWQTTVLAAKPRCPKCGNTGIECYDDPEDGDTHLRECDCPIGRAKKAERIPS